MKLRIIAFEWDKGNTAKCQKHGLTIEQIERVFASKEFRITHDLKHSGKEKRFIAIGKVDRRSVFVAFALRDARIRPISARYMHAKEVKLYEKEIS